MNQAVRELIREILELKGYTVLEAGSPDEAMAVCAQGRPIDLVISRMISPVIVTLFYKHGCAIKVARNQYSANASSG
jgi:CheY-like chemotaxis protein